jgi:hypothetical protein
MTVIEKALALQSVPAFAGLRVQDLTAIARVATLRLFSPAVTAYISDYVLRDLVVVVRGELLNSSSGLPVSPVLGVASLLKDRELGISLCAGDEGAECLLISRGHFFTVIHQCPEIVRSLIERPENKRQVSRETSEKSAGDALFA